MKNLQSNFTTIEQSKQLLELGVPEWTADMFYDVDSEKKYRSWKICPEIIPFNTTYRKYIAYGENFDVFKHEYFYPCWSVGRLIELYCLATGVEYTKIGISEISLTELMIKLIEVAVKLKTFDFSKLEKFSKLELD